MTQPEYSIAPSEPGDTRSKAQCAADPSENLVFIHEDTFCSAMRLARVLVHESCQIRQFEAVNLPTIYEECDVAVWREQECVSREVETVADIDVTHQDVANRAEELSALFEWWAENAVGPPRCPAEFVSS